MNTQSNPTQEEVTECILAVGKAYAELTDDMEFSPGQTEPGEMNEDERQAHLRMAAVCFRMAQGTLRPAWFEAGKFFQRTVQQNDSNG
jgi:hypothetical protein